MRYEEVAVNAQNTLLYEVIDRTDEDVYYPLGLFLSLEEALSAIEDAREPDNIVSNDWELDYVVVEIRERRLGWREPGRTVYTHTWQRIYDRQEGETGGQVWRIVRQHHGPERLQPGEA